MSGERWGVVDEVIYGDPGKGEICLDLDESFKREFVTEDGRRLRLGAVRIGSRGHHTQEVYRFCNMRLGRHIYAIKGMDGFRPIWPRRAGKSRKLPGSNVWTIGVETAKDAIYSKLKVTRPGPAYCHFPIAYQQEFFNQLTSEEVRTHFVRGHPVRYWFKPSGTRNEALDRRVYALAALHAHSVPWEVVFRAAPTEPPSRLPAPPASPLPAPASRFEHRRIRFRIR